MCFGDGVDDPSLTTWAVTRPRQHVGGTAYINISNPYFKDGKKSTFSEFRLM